MAIIFHNKSGNPLVIVDGYFPEKSIIDNIYSNFAKIHGDKFEKIDNVYQTFSELTNKINSLESTILNTRTQRLDSCRDVEHAIIYNDDVVKENGAIEVEEYFKSILSEPNYCINIIADPHTYSLPRLQKYVFNWSSATQFVIKEEAEYKDFTKFSDNIQNLLNDLNETFYNPMNSILDKRFGINNYLNI